MKFTERKMRGILENKKAFEKENIQYMLVLKVISKLFGWVHIFIGATGLLLNLINNVVANNDYYVYTLLFGVTFNSYVNVKSKEKMNNCLSL